MKKRCIFVLGAAVALVEVNSVQAVTVYDANVTSHVIYGTDNTNGDFTVDRTNGIELGLRGKLRHGANGNPQNSYDINNNNNGTYNFAAGVAIDPKYGVPFVDDVNTPLNEAMTGVWSFDWSINSNFDGGAGSNLNGYRYVLGLDSDPTLGTSFIAPFDPINGANPATPGGYWDHSFGTNSTTQGNGVEATNGIPITNGMTDQQIADAHALRTTAYGPLPSSNNLAQNSWKGLWYIPNFNPNLNATYDIFLRAYDWQTNEMLASTSIQIVVGTGGEPAVVPVPAAAPLGLVGMGLIAFLRRRKKNIAA